MKDLMKNIYIDERFNEMTELNKKVNHDDLMYKYKGKTPDEKFDKCGNALNLIDKIRNGETKLAAVKNDHIKFKSNLGEIKKAHKNRSKDHKKSVIQY